MRTLFLLLIPILSFGQIHSVSTQTNQTYAGGKLQLQDAKDQLFGTWTSLHTGVATVGSKSGLVTGVAQGLDTIVYSRTGVQDTLGIYVATSDSSGYYFEGGSGRACSLLEQRDCDGVKILNMWQGDNFDPVTSSSAISKTFHLIYNSVTDVYQIIFMGITTGIGVNYQINIKWNKIKDFSGSLPDSNRIATLFQISSAGF